MSLRSVLHDIIDKIPWRDESTARDLHEKVENAVDLDNSREDGEATAESSAVQPGVVHPATLFGNEGRNS